MADQKSIVLVPFPYSDLSGKKVRPALILSSPKFNKDEDVIICALTSNIKHNRPYSLIVTEQDTVQHRLMEESQVRADTLTRIKKDLIIKEIDVLNDIAFKKVLQILKIIFEEV